MINSFFPGAAPEGMRCNERDSVTFRLPALRPLWAVQPVQRGYDIRPAHSVRQQSLANMLIRRMYAMRGYKTEVSAPALDDPHRITLAAWRYDEVIATLTLRRDSPSGLLADALYAHELNSLRGPQRIVCEVSRLAVDPDFSSRELLNNLFATALSFGREQFLASDAVMEVNPRHVRYYQRKLGFRQLGGLRQCQRVDAPAILLHQRISGIRIPPADAVAAGNDVPTAVQTHRQ